MVKRKNTHNISKLKNPKAKKARIPEVIELSDGSKITNQEYVDLVIRVNYCPYDQEAVNKALLAAESLSQIKIEECPHGTKAKSRPELSRPVIKKYKGA